MSRGRHLQQITLFGGPLQFCRGFSGCSRIPLLYFGPGNDKGGAASGEGWALEPHFKMCTNSVALPFRCPPAALSKHGQPVLGALLRTLSSFKIVSRTVLSGWGGSSHHTLAARKAYRLKGQIAVFGTVYGDGCCPFQASLLSLMRHEVFLPGKGHNRNSSCETYLEQNARTDVRIHSSLPSGS